MEKANEQSTVKCHICGRKFNEEAGISKETTRRERRGEGSNEV